MAGLKLMVADMVVSFLWVLSGALVRVVTAIVASHSLQLKENEELLRWALAVAVMFIFTWLGKITNGASYNPVTVLSNAFATTKAESLFTLAARIPAQAFGSLLGVKFVNRMIQPGDQGPLLKVGLINGMAVEGILTFVIVMVALIVRTRGPKSFFLRTWILCITKLSLSILGANFTGPAMNPATAFGWAYSRGEHRTKEHVYVYWLAPLEACLLAVWTFELLVPSQKKQRRQKLKTLKQN